MLQQKQLKKRNKTNKRIMMQMNYLNTYNLAV